MIISIKRSTFNRQSTWLFRVWESTAQNSIFQVLKAPKFCFYTENKRTKLKITQKITFYMYKLSFLIKINLIFNH